MSTKRLRGFEKGKIGPVDGKDHIGGNYAAAVNFEANLPNALPENTNADVSMFLDFGNVWGVITDSSIDDSNKIRSSTGIIALMSPIGPMNFVLSQNLSKASTDETQSFSFNLGTTFNYENHKITINCHLLFIKLAKIKCRNPIFCRF